MQIKADQISQTLSNPSLGIRLIWIHGDEPILIQAATEEVKTHAHKLLHIEKHEAQETEIEKNTFSIDQHTNWQAILNATQQQSLFASKQLIELRFRNNVIPTAAKDLFKQYTQSEAGTDFMIVTSPRLETKSVKFLENFKQQIIIIPIWPLNPFAYKKWLQQQLSKQQLNLTIEAFTWFFEQSEGNLLNAIQEIQKLKLITQGQTPISLTQIKDNLGFNTRLNIFDILIYLYEGKASRIDQHLEQLKAEGQPLIRLAGAVQKELDILIKLKQASLSHDFSNQAKKLRIFGPKLQAMKHAIERFDEASMFNAIKLAYQLDLQLKGQGPFENEAGAWQLLKQLLLSLSGRKIEYGLTP